MTDTMQRKFRVLNATGFVSDAVAYTMQKHVDVTIKPEPATITARATAAILTAAEFLGLKHRNPSNPHKKFGTQPRLRRGRGGMMKRGWRISDFKGVLISHPRHASSAVRVAA